VSLTKSQREHLAYLSRNGATLLRSGGTLNRRVLNKLADTGLVKITPGGTTAKCPRSGVDVFTPGPDTVAITFEGRVALAGETSR